MIKEPTDQTKAKLSRLWNMSAMENLVKPKLASQNVNYYIEDTFCNLSASIREA